MSNPILESLSKTNMLATRKIEKNSTEKAINQNNVLNRYIQPEREKNYKLNLFVPSPKEWNFFERATEEDILNLSQSIYEIGQQFPIIAFEIDVEEYKKLIKNFNEEIEEKTSNYLENASKYNNSSIYMILAGHTRYKAFELLMKKDDFFNEILARIYKKNSINYDTARQIIIDTNFNARKLKPTEIAKSVFVKYTLLKHSREDNPFPQIVEELGIEERQAKRYKKLNLLCDEMGNLIDTGNLTLANAEIYASLPHDIQAYMSNNFNKEELKKYTSIIKNCKDKKNITKDYITKEINKIIDFEKKYDTVSKKVNIIRENKNTFDTALEILIETLNKENFKKEDLKNIFDNIID